ncbi:MAG TPA: hypothetical protein VJ583_00690 [Nitrososphaeraceae archaeon]|jgi:hypothetical protein|nr:hypothetical protein [Nitrososphaeraceae archaeon]
MITQGVLRYKANDGNWYNPEEIISLINKNTYTFVVNMNDIEIILKFKHFKNDKDIEAIKI